MVNEADIKPWLRPAATSYIFHNASVIDVDADELCPNLTLTVEDGKITSISPSLERPTQKPGFRFIDCSGKYICPGLIDSHVHLIATPGFSSLAAAFGNPVSVGLLRQSFVCAHMLHRGFTSIWDCDGAHAAIKEAIEDGVFLGPDCSPLAMH